MHLSDEQKVIIHDALDAMHARLFETRVHIYIAGDLSMLREHDEYTERVADLLAIFRSGFLRHAPPADAKPAFGKMERQK